MLFAVKLLEPRAGVAQADAFLQSRVFGQATAIVLHVQFKLVLAARRPQNDLTPSRMRGDPMLDRVLDERLQEKIGYVRSEGFRFNLAADGEALTEARLLDFQVAIKKIQFLAQRHLLGVSASSAYRNRSLSCPIIRSARSRLCARAR
jgi:hypothetical protein